MLEALAIIKVWPILRGTQDRVHAMHSMSMRIWVLGGFNKEKMMQVLLPLTLTSFVQLYRGCSIGMIILVFFGRGR